MRLKDAVKKVNEKVQGMAARPYIDIDRAAGEDMTVYHVRIRGAVGRTEAPEGNQAENSAQETEKGKEGASDEATDALQEWLATLPEEKRQELAVVMTKLAENLKKVWEEIFESIRTAIEHLATFYREYFRGMDKWELEKMKMPNNERRRCGPTMVRRQAHVRNLRNGWKCRRRK